MLSLKRLHHLAIICSDYQRSKRFYCDMLGATVIAEYYRAERDSYKLDLRLADCQIELFSFPHPPERLTHPEACGLRHMAFEVESVEKVRAELVVAGVGVEEIRRDPYTNKNFTFFKDPDGLPIEIYES